MEGRMAAVKDEVVEDRELLRTIDIVAKKCLHRAMHDCC